MNSLNRVTLIGRLGADPEVRYLEGGTAKAAFRMATTESYVDKNSGQRVENTQWHSIVAWRKLAEIAEKYLRKGALIYVEGKLNTRSWDDKDGNKKYITEVVADNFIMLDKKGEGGSSIQEHSSESASSSAAPKPTSATEGDNYADDLPF